MLTAGLESNPPIILLHGSCSNSVFWFPDVAIDGYENHTVEAKRLLGYVPEFPVLYPMLTVTEHLEFIAKAYRLAAWEENAEALLHRFELDDKKMKLGKELSKGMQQKVSVCCALLPQPKAVVMDEPLVGLDPHGIRELKAVMAKLRDSGCALLVSTHMIESVEEDWPGLAGFFCFPGLPAKAGSISLISSGLRVSCSCSSCFLS